MGGGSVFIVKYNKRTLAAYALGGTIAEEAISSIRDATAFNTQKKLARQYDLHLIEAEKSGFKMRMALATMLAGMMGIVYLNHVGLSLLTAQSFRINYHTGPWVLARLTVSCLRRYDTCKHCNGPPCRDDRRIFSGECCA
jgi:ATP-binding cassette, subfamily B (MDR/TAP), member 1